MVDISYLHLHLVFWNLKLNGVSNFWTQRHNIIRLKYVGIAIFDNQIQTK